MPGGRPVNPASLKYQPGYVEHQRRKSREAYARRKKHNPDWYWESHLKRKYGLTREEYDALVEAQNGVCAICGKTCAERKRLSVDHDHETGQIRGLLCRRCNTAIGLLGDSLDGLLRAVEYLDSTVNFAS